LLTWWSSPIDTADGLKSGNSISFIRLGLVQFATRGITPIGYAVFAFALGVTAGVLIRRTVPAMAATLAGFAFVQIAWPSWIRPHLIAHARAVVALTAAGISSLAQGSNNSMSVNPPASAGQPGAWLRSTQTVDKAGHMFNAATIGACRGSNFQACRAALGGLHLSDVISYQPASQPVLGVPVVRDGHFRRPRRHPGRSVLLADPPWRCAMTGPSSPPGQR
jgi:hypothetical protein